MIYSLFVVNIGLNADDPCIFELGVASAAAGKTLAAIIFGGKSGLKCSYRKKSAIMKSKGCLHFNCLKETRDYYLPAMIQGFHEKEWPLILFSHL